MSNIRLIKTKLKSSSFLSSVKNKKNISERKTRKNNSKFVKGELRGRLFKLINNSILLSDEKIKRLKEEINNDKYELFLKEKADEKNKTTKQPFNYWAQNTHLITAPKTTMRFEDEYISPIDLFEKQFNEKERQIILSAPYHYGLNHEMLEELHIFSPKNLTQVLDKEENEHLYTIQYQKSKNKIKELNNSYNNNLNKKGKNLKDKIAKTSFNKSFPRIKKTQKTKIDKCTELYKNFPLNSTNSNSGYYNTYSNMNKKLFDINKIISELNNDKNNKTNYMSFKNIKDLRLINHYEKMIKIQNDFSKKIENKTIIDEEKHKKYKERKQEINEYNKKKIIFQSIIDNKRQIKSYNEKQRMMKEKMFIDKCLNILKSNYRDKSYNYYT
jgi:hypothetical protein